MDVVTKVAITVLIYDASASSSSDTPLYTGKLGQSPSHIAKTVDI